MKVAVIGAGIVGVSTALWLQRDGAEVILIDRVGPAEGTSYGNAGVLASCSVVPVTTPGLIGKAPKMLFSPDEPLFLKWGYLPKLAPWLVRYLRHANADDARRIAAALVGLVGESLADHQAVAEGTPAARYIAPSDYTYAYRDKAAFEGDAFTWELRRAHGFVPVIDEGTAVAAYDPLLGPEVSFLARVPGHGHIKDPGAYVKALADHAVANGARLVIGTAQDVARAAGTVIGVVVDGETIAADAVVVATGVWSGPLAEALGIKVPLESERGYHIELLEPSAMPVAPTMFPAGKFVATPMEGRLRIAGVVEFGGLDAPPSRAPFALLEKGIRKAMPTLTWKGTTEWMGHRPATTDSLPLIGPVPGVKGAYLGFGHQHVGLTSGPKTGRLLAQLVMGRTPNIDITPYAPSRFSSSKPSLAQQMETTG
ncbi:NAD(P)/FAD-dependent oxidoreductase [Acuticoccus mangrovi]|uniref:FAD-binding oxidoreductase n=1 Tax=Acuticoccus mangrovi TaxID=2796142 RepID=A0A934IQM7_9HYPH|nr:FAD-binding oxidoreductase [Acuticoccus mangrovi]MBJ3778307.1 FAD-binding oxidoreductase [Acuticoccus mangrovi]